MENILIEDPGSPEIQAAIINPEDIVISPVKGVRNDPEPQDEDDQPLNADSTLNTPIIEHGMYDLLPKVLREGSEIFTSRREKDVFLTSAITVLSGCLPTVHGIYDGKRVNANLFSFIIAPAASGKSAIIGAKDLGQKIHNEMVNQAESDVLTIGPSPQTRHRVLFIPGNISAAAMISILRDNDGVGVICETEADSMGNCLKQDWGGFSDLLRKAFHHEHVSYARKQGNQFIEIPRPKLSVSLSGTPSQVKSIVRSIEDGLFSRFIFYIFKSPPVWRDPSPSATKVAYETRMSALQDNIQSVYDQAKKKEYLFDLPIIQWLKLNKQYSSALSKSTTFIGDGTASSVFRLGLIHFRIAMILATLRYFEDPDEGDFIGCTEYDYSIAEYLCDIYLQHGLLVYKILTNQLNTGLGDNIEKFYKALPAEPFQRKEAVIIGEKLKMAERTINKYLKILRDNGFLKHDAPGSSYELVTQ